MQEFITMSVGGLGYEAIVQSCIGCIIASMILLCHQE